MLKGNAYAVRDSAGDIIAYHWSGEVAKAILALERELTDLMIGELPVIEFTGATLLRDGPLRQSGYLDTLPCIPLYAVPHLQTHDGVQDDRRLLSTASCFHVLAAVADRTADTPLSCYTCSAVCHRAEGGPDNKVLRLTSFRMRELVLLGEETQVVAQAERAFQRLFDHLSGVLPKAWQEEATDVFYGANANAMRRFQSAKKVKKEIVTPWSEHEDYAVASWNMHGSRLVSAFGGLEQGHHSACVAFGLERLALSLLAADANLLPQDFLAAFRVG